MSWIRLLLHLPPGGSTFADGIDRLHFFLFSITMTAAAAIAALTAYYLVRFRARSPAQITAEVHGSTIGEAGIVVSILVLFVALWVVGFKQYVNMETPPNGALVVDVTAKEWMWKFAYSDGYRAINVLTVPVGRPVKLVMTSRDVIHSFYVPGFRIKQDVIPGRYVTAWFEATTPGSYDLYCAEYCGISHSRMLGTVTVLSSAEYASWRMHDGVAPQSDEDFTAAGGVGTPSSSNLAELGRTIAVRAQCFACHTVDGQPHIGPTWRGLYLAEVPLETGRTILADETYLTRSMMDPLSDVHRGFRPVMPTYQGVLSAPESAAIVEFIKSLQHTTENPKVALPAIDGIGTIAPSTAQGGRDGGG